MPLSCHLLLCFPRCELLQTHQASHMGHRAPCNAHVSLGQHAVSSLKAWWRWNVQLYKVQFLNMIKHTQPQTCCLYVLRCLVPEVLSTMDLFTSGKEKVKLGELQALNFLMLSGLSDPGGQDDTGGLTLRGWLNIEWTIQNAIFFCHHSHTLVLLPYGGWDVLHWLISHVNCHAPHSLKKIIPDRQASWLIYKDTWQTREASPQLDCRQTDKDWETEWDICIIHHAAHSWIAQIDGRRLACLLCSTDCASVAGLQGGSSADLLHFDVAFGLCGPQDVIEAHLCWELRLSPQFPTAKLQNI